MIFRNLNSDPWMVRKSSRALYHDLRSRASEDRGRRAVRRRLRQRFSQPHASDEAQPGLREVNQSVDQRTFR